MKFNVTNGCFAGTSDVALASYPVKWLMGKSWWLSTGHHRRVEEKAVSPALLIQNHRGYEEKDKLCRQ